MAVVRIKLSIHIKAGTMAGTQSSSIKVLTAIQSSSNLSSKDPYADNSPFFPRTIRTESLN